MMEYEDFSIKIEPKRGDTYPVIVLRSPAGEGRSEFRLPFDPDEIGDVLFELGESVRGGGSSAVRSASPAAIRTRPQQVGDELFNAVFSGPVLSLLERSMGMIHGGQRGLRIKIHIDPEDPSLTQLASLPWEFIYRKDTRDFLNLSKFTPIIRYLDVQRPYTPLPLEPPLRILVVISDPVDYTGLDLERERTLIEKTWAQQEGVQVEFMEDATILGLQDRLSQRPYHVLHYMGHGAFDENSGQGVLVMEDEQELGHLVDGSALGVLLRDVPTMRLVFLNACETAKVTRDQGVDPFSGVAASMVLAGIPAVVAMQFPISDSAAITFSRKFYPMLAQGNPVDVAVAEGRRAIRLADSGSMEWATPVLFMRAPKGDIFRVRQKAAAQIQAAAPAAPAPAVPAEAVSEAKREPEAKTRTEAAKRGLPKWAIGAGIGGFALVVIIALASLMGSPTQPAVETDATNPAPAIADEGSSAEPAAEEASSAAAVAPTPEPTATEAATPTQPAPSQSADVSATVLDTFESNANGWFTGEQEDELSYTLQEINNGKYVWEIRSYQDVIALANPNTPWATDFSLSVDARQVSGGQDIEYGLLFRKQDDDNYYTFTVDADRYFSVGLLVQGDWADPLIDWTQSTAIRPGQVNTLGVEAEGSHFSFYINDQLVGEVDDARLDSGRGGLAIGAFDANIQAVFEFDNFELNPL